MFEKRNETRQEEAAPDSTRPAPAGAGLRKAAVIGPTITITGDIAGDENLVIEGKVEGKINLPSHQVEVGKAGRVHADVVAKYIKVEGEMRGDIDGKEKVIISASGNVRGNITAPRVMLEDGAIFKGSIDINPNDSAPVELPVSSQKTADNVKPLGNEVAKKDSGYTAKGG